MAQQKRVGIELEQVIAALPSPAYVCEAPSGILRLWNRRAADLWGREPQPGAPEVRFCGSLRLFRPDGSALPHDVGPVAQTLRREQPGAAIVLIERPDGSRVTARVHASPLRDAENRMNGVLAVVQEVPQENGDPGAYWLSEARYRAIVEDQPDLVCRFLGDGTVTFANEAYCRYFGLRREEAIGKQYTPVVHPDDSLQVDRLVASLSPANPVVLIENRVVRSDGAVRWTQWTNRAIYDDYGSLLEFQSAGRDVTERKQAEEDLARLAAIVTGARSAIFSMTLDGIIRSWNRAAERMFGYSAADAIGQPNQIIIPPDRLEEGAELLDRLREGETVEHLETERVARDGRRIPVSLTISPIVDATGRVIGISKIARDITERKRAERELEEREGRFRLLADHAPVLIWVADTRNRGIYFNKPWIDFTGVPLDLQVGDGWLALVHPDDRGAAGAYRQDRFDRRLPFTKEYRLRHHTGEYRWVLDTGQPLLIPDGTFNGYIGTCLDIHERKRLEAAREEAVTRESEARAAAEEASRLKDEFLAVVSHELRTPLNAILGWARMLRDGSVGPHALPKALDTIERNARVQGQLVEDLLDVSRIVSGKLSLRMEIVEAASVIHAAVEVVRPAAGNKGIDLRLDLMDPSIAVSADAGRLQQAVWNLLTNAVKFTPAGGRVEVALGRAGPDALITVRDSGTGIQPEALPFIFDRFWQADSRTTRAHGGLGLGLTIVAYVAEAHGGTVRAESAGPGLGTTFELRLPLPAEMAAIAPRAIATARPDLSGWRILAVDDEPDARDLVREILEGCGAIVTTAASVAEALAIVRASATDVLIGDIGIPVQDGYDLVRLVRAVTGLECLPAIALTAYAGQPHRESARQAGYDAYITKPVDPHELCAAVAELRGTRSADRGESDGVDTSSV